MSTQKKFPFYKHLIIQQCRKDIILENEFLNTKIKNRNTPLFEKIKDRTTKNKMRLAYLVGFSIIFALNGLYDGFFGSFLYSSFANTTQRVLLKLDGGISFDEVNYKNPKAAELGRYFLSLQGENNRKQITANLLSVRVPSFSQYKLDSLDVNSFVEFCMRHSIGLQQLPLPGRL